MVFKLAVIGLGAVTRNIHLPAYAQLKDRIEIVGGCDPDPGAREQIRKTGRINGIYENAEEMLLKTKPDIVSICTPPGFHKENCRLAIESGAHIFCEKPFMPNLHDADEIIEMAEKASLRVVVNNQFKYLNIHKKSKELIGSEQFGKLLFIHASQTFTPTDSTEAGWRKKMENRVCFEFGIHVFDLIRFYFDMEPSRIYAYMPKPSASVRTDLINVISLEFPDGRGASILLDRMSKGPERYLDMRLDGEFGAIENSIGGKLEFNAGMHTKNRKPFINFQFALGGQAALLNGNSRKVIAKDPLNPFATSTAEHFAQFLNGLENGAMPTTTAKENRNTLALVFAAYDSAKTGLPVDISNYYKDSPV